MLNRNSRNYVEKSWPEGASKMEKDKEGIEKYYKTFHQGEYGNIDDQSYFDLTMDTVYDEMNGTYSSAGESMLYNMLRVPVRNQEILDKRQKFMKYFSEHDEDRINVQAIIFDLGRDKRFQFLDLLKTNYAGSKTKRIAYFIMGRILPALVFLSGLFLNPMIFLGLIPVLFINSLIAAGERQGGKKPFAAIYYGNGLFKAAKRLKGLNLEILNEHMEKIDIALDKIGSNKNKMKKFTGSMVGGAGSIEILEPFVDIFGAIVLNVENAYYSMIDGINDSKDELKVLYEVIGEIDALITAQGYSEATGYETTKPLFIENEGFEIIDGAHPLIENVITNSITIDKKGIVLTGTNMSGKSTFLRMLGINIVLAQSFNFVFAKKYKAEFLNFVSSISPDDDINSGKSYYLAEAESLLRVIHALNGDYKVFCAIDEIFRGTNPVERIAASEEILRYIQKHDSVSIVATHDRELTDLLSETHKFYHFSERVSESDGLSFDYKLKEGILTTRNAIKLLKYVGYPDEIIDGAYRAIARNHF